MGAFSDKKPDFDQNEIPCTGCVYCTGSCPMNIAIPKYFSLYNKDMRENGRTVSDTDYDALTKNSGKPGDCISCCRCVDVCPLRLPIPDFLRDVAEYYEE